VVVTFRSRLTAAFIAVAAATTAVFGVTSYLLVRQYRTERFKAEVRQDAALVAFSASRRPTLAEFEALLGEFQRRADFEAVVVSGDVSFSSSPSITERAVPQALTRLEEPGGVELAPTEVAGGPFLVAAVTPSPSASRFYFFFSRAELLQSLSEYRNALAVGWIAGVVVAALFGRAVARRTLRPIGAAATASRALAEGLLETRLEADRRDEFGQLADSFNRMAQELAKKMDALARAADRERRFTADAAHDLRTPVTGMVSAAAVVEEDFDRIPPEAQPGVRLLLDDVERLHGLVLDLLDLSRVDAGEQPVPREVLPVLEAVTEATRSWADDRRAVEVDIDPALHVVADPARFSRVVGNLLANAMTHGGGRARVTARQDGNRVAIEVKDQGMGIPESDLDRIFDRFYKGDPARSRGGSGLGLAIALENARMEGGSLSVANVDGGGSCFTLTLPMATPAAGPEAS
jgi:signal transduction histidine kinase